MYGKSEALQNSEMIQSKECVAGEKLLVHYNYNADMCETNTDIQIFFWCPDFMGE